MGDSLSYLDNLLVVDNGHFNQRYCVPLAFRMRSLWIPSRNCVPFINMHNGRVHDVTYCYNLGKNAFLHTNKVST